MTFVRVTSVAVPSVPVTSGTKLNACAAAILRLRRDDGTGKLAGPLLDAPVREAACSEASFLVPDPKRPSQETSR